MVDCSTNDDDPVISTTHGKVRGKLRETVYGDHFYCFDGIPYAKPPLGELRFKPTKPVESWTGVRDCTVIAPKCIQYNRFIDSVEGSEDCLYLNIYAKKLKSEKPLPVMVYLYGGGFATGTASRLAWGPDYFMMRDVILITIGYRTGALGFLGFPEQELEVSGNAGIKDVIMALKWLKPNYLNFNGDPERVTIFGNSSGSSLAHILTMASQCEGLFHRAIFMSGLFTVERNIPNIPFKLAKRAGYVGPNDNKKILNYLLSLEAEKLVDFRFFNEDETFQGRSYAFLPMVEYENAPDAILTKQPRDIFGDKKAWSNNIPILLGTTADEELIFYKFFTNPKLYETLKIHPEYLLPLDVQINYDSETQKQLASKIIKLHFGDKEVALENAMYTIKIASYGFQFYPYYEYLSSRLKHAKAPTYFYRFAYDSPDFNLYRIKLCGPEVRGVGHVDDLSYIFYMNESFKLPRDSDNFKTIERMIDIFTTFAANAQPSTDGMEPDTWKPLSPDDTYKCLNISNDLTIIDWPEMENCKLWEQFRKEAGIK